MPTSPIKLIDKTAAAGVIDEAQVEEFLGFGPGDLGVPSRLDSQRIVQTFDGWVAVLDEQFVIRRLGAFEDRPIGATGVFAHDLDGFFLLGLEEMNPGGVAL